MTPDIADGEPWRRDTGREVEGLAAACRDGLGRTEGPTGQEGE